jgi:ABC-type dipeptide/oligopeptide/nickel transport system ATPase component
MDPVNQALAKNRTADEAIAIDNFSVAYRTPTGPVSAVKNVSFALKQSESLAIVGESGSGKTTLATGIAGLLPWDVADIGYDAARIAGRAIDLHSSRSVVPVRHDGVSMIFQDAMTSLDPVASVAHQFRTVLSARGGMRRAAIRTETMDWIEHVGIHEPQRVMKLRSYEMSGGMRQRIMIALALCSRPKVLLSDEPTSALDASVSRRIMDLVLKLTQELGTALIIITHDVDLARTYTDRTLVLYRGEVQDLCLTSELLSPERSDYTRALMACVPRLGDHDADLLPTLVIDSDGVRSVVR